MSGTGPSEVDFMATPHRYFVELDSKTVTAPDDAVVLGEEVSLPLPTPKEKQRC